MDDISVIETMDSLPVEIMQSIASFMSCSDLCNLRLVNRAHAAALYPVISQNLCMVDTASGVESFWSYITECGGSLFFTKSLTIFYGEWPHCTQGEFEVHPLLHREIHPRHLKASATQSEVTLAYQKYKAFMDEEDDRCSSGSLDTLFRILRSIPNVQSVVVRHIRTLPKGKKNAKISCLLEAIWLRPRLRGLANSICQNISTIRPISATFVQFQIMGRLGLDELWLSEMGSVHILQVDCATFRDQFSVVRFMSAFPNVEELTFGAKRFGEHYFPLNQMQLPRLRVLRLQNICLSENTLLTALPTMSLLDTLILTNSSLSTENSGVLLEARLRNMFGNGSTIELDQTINGNQIDSLQLRVL